jgi:hypothetical protein
MFATRFLFPPVLRKTGTSVRRRGPRRRAPIVTTLEDRALLTVGGSVPFTPLAAGPHQAIHHHNPDPAGTPSQVSLQAQGVSRAAERALMHSAERQAILARRTRVNFPGGFVNSRPGQTLVNFPGGSINSAPARGRVRFPGGFVNSRPGRNLINFPGGFVNSRPGQTLVNFPGGFVNSGPGGTVIKYPGGFFHFG